MDDSTHTMPASYHHTLRSLASKFRDCLHIAIPRNSKVQNLLQIFNYTNRTIINTLTYFALDDHSRSTWLMFHQNLLSPCIYNMTSTTTKKSLKDSVFVIN